MGSIVEILFQVSHFDSLTVQIINEADQTLNFLKLYIPKISDEKLSQWRNVNISIFEMNSTTNHITISLGVASMIPMKDAPAHTIIEIAGSALYAAKMSSRNCVKKASSRMNFIYNDRMNFKYSF